MFHKGYVSTTAKYILRAKQKRKIKNQPRETNSTGWILCGEMEEQPEILKVHSILWNFVISTPTIRSVAIQRSTKV